MRKILPLTLALAAGIAIGIPAGAWLLTAAAPTFLLVLLGATMLLPLLVARGSERLLGVDSTVLFNVIDGIVRIALFIGYIWAIGRSAEIGRVFEYHGAEHKTIHAYENGDPLVVPAIQRYSPRHPRRSASTPDCRSSTRFQAGKPPISSSAARASSTEWTGPPRHTERPIFSIASLNWSRSSAFAITSARAPIISTP